MAELKRIMGSSIFSFLLVVWGLFMVCSGRVPDVTYDDDMFAESDDSGSVEDGNAELMDQLAALDDESSQLEDYQKNEILEALGIGPEEAALGSQREEDFLSEELFLDLEVEIAELERMASRKDLIADSLRLEVEEASYQLNALNNLMNSDQGSPQIASNNFSAPVYTPDRTDYSGSNYNDLYQSALDDVYARRHQQAIGKFQQLLKMDDNDNLADNCQYWIGESFYALGNYELAIVEFERVFAFDDNNKADDAQFMIGIAYIKLGNQRHAELELKNLLSFYQDSEYISRAEQEFGDLNI